MNRIGWLLPLVAAAAMAPETAVIAAGPMPGSGGNWVDLTHDFSTETLYWPTSSGFKLTQDFAGVTPQGYFYTANSFQAAEHGGTHIDAPAHFAQGHLTVDRIPLENLIGNAVVVDVSAKVQADADYQVQVADFEDWEGRYGRIPEGAILLINTGFHRRWPDAVRYLGTAEKGAGAIGKLHFPGLHPDAARWLTGSRRIKCVGLDTASIDYGQSPAFEAHRILYENNVPGLENVANLDRLPPTGAFIVALPMKIKDGSGGPARIVAWLPGGAAD